MAAKSIMLIRISIRGPTEVIPALKEIRHYERPVEFVCFFSLLRMFFTGVIP